MELGAPELIIILIIVVLIFGVGRISKLGGELGQGLRAFRRGLQVEEQQPEDKPTPESDKPDQAVNGKTTDNS